MKSIHWIFVLCAALVGLTTFSCKKKQKTYNFHYDYFPISEGKYVTYKVQEITIDDALLVNDTLNYYVKAIFGDTMIDNEGRIVRRYERYFSSSANGPWTLNDIWTGIITNGRAELVEENNRTIKLVFAPTITEEWNANAYNTLDELNCYYNDIHLPYSVGSMDFDSTVTVEQENELNFIQYKRKYEVYAKGVGMIQKVFIDCEIYNYDPTNITKGRKFFMDVIDFGTE